MNTGLKWLLALMLIAGGWVSSAIPGNLSLSGAPGLGWLDFSRDYEWNRQDVIQTICKSVSLHLGGSGYVPVRGDYDGDGLADPAVYQEAGGIWRVLLSGGDYVSVSAVLGTSGYEAVSGDFDGDGRTDPAVYAAAGGKWQITLSASGYPVIPLTFGGTDYEAVAGDFDGDGRADPAIYSAGNGGLWRIMLSGSGYVMVEVMFGGQGYQAAPADYDNDGRTDPAVVNSSNGTWRVLLSSGGYVPVAAVFSTHGSQPVVDDYDGDNRADPAVFDASAGLWEIMRSASGYTCLTTNFGAGGLPFHADYDGNQAAEWGSYNPESGVWRVALGPSDDDEVTGNTYYVATTGNNSNPGTRESPWATPGYGSRQLQPGDTLIILGGAYTITQYDADDIVPISGTAAAWITVRGETGNRPVLQGSGGLRAAVDIGGKNYVAIENLELTSLIDNPYSGGLGQGIEGGGSGAGAADISHVRIKDVYMHHLESGGINFSGDMNNVLVSGTRIDHACLSAIGAPASYGRGGWKNVVISNCYLGYSGHFYEGQVHDDVSLYDRPDGFGIEPSDGPVEIVWTTSEHNFGDGLDSKSRNTFIRNCLVVNNSCDGVKLWGGGSRVENTLIYGRGDGNTTTTPWSPLVVGTDQTNAVFEIVNVTIDDELGENYLVHVQYDDPQIPIGLTIRNTIFSSRGPNAGLYFGQAVTGAVEYNLFYTPASGTVLQKGQTSYDSSQIGNLGTGNLYGNPQFIATGFGTTGNYHVAASSPAVDGGAAVYAPAVDLENKSRPRSGACDIGAYEQ